MNIRVELMNQLILEVKLEVMYFVLTPWSKTIEQTMKQVMFMELWTEILKNSYLSF